MKSKIALYDNLDINTNILLDLPFREGIGTITHDVAKPHHTVDLINTPTWTALDSGLMTLDFNGTSEYLEASNASTADLGFTSGDFSIGGWFNWADGDESQIIIGRYELDVGGWEVYLYDNPNWYLTLRLHHAGGVEVRTACYSSGWTQDTWHFMGISRTGSTAIMYRNGVALTTTGVLEDAEATTKDLVVGCRFTKDDDYFKNKMRGMRAWSRALSADDWLAICNIESRWFA